MTPRLLGNTPDSLFNRVRHARPENDLVDYNSLTGRCNDLCPKAAGLDTNRKGDPAFFHSRYTH